MVEITAAAKASLTIPEHRDLDPDGDPTPWSQGSGFIIDGEGYILTNYHVVADAAEVEVTLHDGTVLAAEVRGTDRESDLALLAIDAQEVAGIRPLPLGDSDAARPGQMAIALGSPFVLSCSVTVGIISGVDRSLASSTARLITQLLQTDAAINPGNSGGPLLNSAGEVVGINTAIESPNSGIGYAVPINRAKSILSSLREGGEVGTPWLGISGQAVNPELAEELELPVTSGVYVVQVWEDSPAEAAGLRGADEDLRGGDTITGVDGVEAGSVLELLDYFNSRTPGDVVSLTVVRGDETLTVEATLAEWPEDLR